MAFGKIENNNDDLWTLYREPLTDYLLTGSIRSTYSFSIICFAHPSLGLILPGATAGVWSLVFHFSKRYIFSFAAAPMSILVRWKQPAPPKLHPCPASATQHLIAPSCPSSRIDFIYQSAYLSFLCAATSSWTAWIFTKCRLFRTILTAFQMWARLAPARPASQMVSASLLITSSVSLVTEMLFKPIFKPGPLAQMQMGRLLFLQQSPCYAWSAPDIQAAGRRGRSISATPPSVAYSATVATVDTTCSFVIKR